MKKLFLSVVVVAVLAVVFGTVGYVYAQAPTPQAGVPGTGYGMGGGRGAHGGMMGAAVAGTQEGPLHDAMIAAYAEKLGIPAADLEARLSKGETMAQIASSKGLTAEQFRSMMVEARAQAIDQAVKAGTLTQEQADWMKQRGAGMGGGMGGGRGRGAKGNGQGQFSNPACPYYTAPAAQ
jgi:hypothetical protein